MKYLASVILLAVLMAPGSAAAYLETGKGTFQTPGSPGDVYINAGVEPDLIVFRITSTNSNFNSTQKVGGVDYGWGHGFAECTDSNCTEVAQSQGSGSSSTNGYAAASTTNHSIFQIITDGNGDNFEGNISGTVTGRNSTGFNVSFNHTHEQQYVMYSAYDFPDSADVKVGHFKTKDSTGDQTVSTGFNPDFVHTVTSPQINNMGYFESTGDGGAEHGWSLGWASEKPDETIEQVAMDTTLYANNVDSHVFASDNSEIIHTLWKQNSGNINGRLEASLDSFSSSGFKLSYDNVNPDTTDGSQFLVTYFAIGSEAQPDIGYDTSPTSEQEQLVETDVKMDSINFLASNTHKDMNVEGFSGNNNNDNHWGWMFGSGNSTSQRSIGFSSHSNSVNGHARGSSNVSAIRLMFSDQNGNILGRDQARIDKINRTGFQLDWNSIVTSSTGDVKYDSSTFVYWGFGQPPEQKSEYVKTSINDKPRSFVSKGRNITIETAGEFESNPKITIIDSNGTSVVDGGSLTNVSNRYRYNYSVNDSYGWFDVEINDERWNRSFYQAEKWEGNYTDSSGLKYSFRKRLNITEPNVSDRWFEPVDTNLTFDFNPDPDSVRLVAYNGSRNIEIPHQLYNSELVSGELNTSNIVFPVTINQTESRSYFVMSSKSGTDKNYSDVLKLSESGDEYTLSSPTYKANFRADQGGLLSTLNHTIGEKDGNIGGTSPMNHYPEFQIGVNEITPREETAKVTTTSGPLFTRLEITGNASQDTSKPYSMDCKAYARSSYITCEKNQSTTSDETVSDFFTSGLLMADRKMDYVSYTNSTLARNRTDLKEGDNSDLSGIDDQLNWISFYDNRTGDAIAELFLNRDFNKESNPQMEIQDNANNDFYRYKIIDSADISQGDYFYLKTAKLVYNGARGQDFVNQTYNQLENPVTVFKGSTKTDDSEKPEYFSATNVSTNDSAEAEIQSYWTDDGFLDYAVINVTGNGVNGSNSQIRYNDSRNIRDDGFVNESWVNVTLSADEINAGEIQANITVHDISGKTNSTEIKFNVSDVTDPEFNNVVNSPSDENSLDPNVQVNITANITDYSNVSSAKLYYRNKSGGSWSSYNVTNMSRSSIEGFKNTYKANFTPTEGTNYSYYVWAEDENGLTANSSETTLEIKNDTSWNLTANLNDVTGNYSENLTAGNITVENTGDSTTSFNLTSDFADRVWFNNTKAPYQTSAISPDGQTFLEVNVSTRDGSESEGVDNFTITVKNDSLETSKRDEYLLVTTSTGGPFLYPTIDRYDPEVTQGDSDIKLKASVENTGNTTALSTSLNFQLPDGWSASGSNSTSSSSQSVTDGSSFSFTTYVDIGDSAATGSKELVVFANSSNAANRSASETVTVNEASSGSGSGGGGGGDGSGSGGGGGLGLASQEEEQQKLEFSTNSTITLVRGKQTSFRVKISNPLEDEDLEDISVSVSGFLKPYISLENNTIKRIEASGSKYLTVTVESPEYLERGTETLDFTISGVINTTETRTIDNLTITSGSVTEVETSKEVTLRIREYSMENASKFLNRTREVFKELEASEIKKGEIRRLKREAERSFEGGNFVKLKKNRDKLEKKLRNLEEVRNGIEELEQNMAEEDNGFSETRRMMELAEEAKKRGDLESARQRLREAQDMYSLESKDVFSPVDYASENWKKLFLLVILGSGGGLVAYIRAKIKWLERKIQRLENREEAIKDLMKDLQKETLEEEKESLERYEEQMLSYEEELAEVIQQKLEKQSKRAWLLKIGRKEEMLKHERDQLVEMLENAQESYYNEKKISKRIYELEKEKLHERITEVEGELAEKTAAKKASGGTGWFNGNI